MKLRFPAFLGRRRQAAVQPASPPARDAGPGEPLLLPSPDGAPPLVTVAILALGMEGEELARLADAVLASIARQAYRPVFLVDTRDLGVLRERALAFEYLSAPPANHDAGLHDRFLLARLAIWQRKWQLARIVTAGAVSRRKLEAWRASGEAEPALAALLTAASPAA